MLIIKASVSLVVVGFVRPEDISNLITIGAVIPLGNMLEIFMILVDESNDRVAEDDIL